MYQIFANDTCIFDDRSPDIALKITDGTLSLEDNTAGTCTFTLPITNAGYNIIERMRTHIVVKREGEKIWGGRVLSEDEDFYKNKTYTCEGEFAYFNDTFQPLEEYYGLTLRQFLEVILHVHNNKCNGDNRFTSYSNPPEKRKTFVDIEDGKTKLIGKSTYDSYISYQEITPKTYPTPTDGNGESSVVTGHLDKRIYVGQLTVSDTTNNEYRCTNFESTMEVLQSLIERLGGHMRIRTAQDGKMYLDYLKDFPNTTRQKVTLAKNLLDLSKNFDLSELCTVLLPLGAKKNEGDLVGDEKKVHWNRSSVLDSVGRIRLGKYFYRTEKIPVQKEVVITEFVSGDSSDQIQERTVQCSLTYSGEQVGGYYYVYFYDDRQYPISGQQAQSTTENPADRGTQIFRDAPITIPANAKYAAFGFYFGGEANTVPFQVAYNENEYWTRYTNVSFLHGELVGTSGYIINQYGQFVPPFDDTYVVSSKIKVKEKETYFITSRQNEGHGIFCVYGEDGRPIYAPDMAGSGSTYTDWEKNKKELPAGASFMVVAGKTDSGLNPIVYDNYKSRSDYYDPPDEYVTIESVNNGNLYLASQNLINKYGWIEKTVVWEDMTNPTDLLARANEYLSITQFNEPTSIFEAVTIEVKAYDLHYVDSSSPPIGLWDKVRVESSVHGINGTKYPVTKLEIPFLDPANATYTLGVKSEGPSLTTASTSADLEIFERLSEVPKPSSILSGAKANATELINMKTEGYVSIDENEILIMDTPDKESADRIWRFNVNGIGYSNTGYAGTFGLAMTMDGAFVADRITTGYMHADRIRGGILTLGGYDNVNGEFYMKNAKGKNFVKMTKDGAEMIVKISQPASWIYNGSSQARTYGVVEYDRGAITGYSASIRAEVDGTLSQDWFNNYSFAFSDITKSDALTKIDLLSHVGSNTSASYVGITMLANYGFGLYCRDPDETVSSDFAACPNITLSKVGQSGGIVLGKTGSNYIGMYYTRSAFVSHDTPMPAPFTLEIRNDGTPDGYDPGLGIGGVSLVSGSAPISFYGSDVYLRTGTMHVYHSNEWFNGYSGSFEVLVGSNGQSFWTGTVTVKNGIVVGFSSG